MKRMFGCVFLTCMLTMVTVFGEQVTEYVPEVPVRSDADYEEIEYDIDTELLVGDEYRNNRAAFSEFCVEYCHLIAYKQSGREYGETILRYAYGTYGVTEEELVGLDEHGFIIYAFRTITGNTPQAAKDPKAYMENNPDSVVTNPADVRVGDICFNKDDNSMAVVAGHIEGIPIVAICNGMPLKYFKGGALHLAYLGNNSGNRNIAGVPAEYFEYIIRPDVEWVN